MVHGKILMDLIIEKNTKDANIPLNGAFQISSKVSLRFVDSPQLLDLHTVRFPLRYRNSRTMQSLVAPVEQAVTLSISFLYLADSPGQLPLEVRAQASCLQRSESAKAITTAPNSWFEHFEIKVPCLYSSVAWPRGTSSPV